MNLKTWDLFSWRFWGEQVQQWSLYKVTWSVWMSFSWERKWIVIKSSRENWKGLKTDPVFAKHAFFETRVSRQQVARASRQNTQRQNCGKIFYVFFAIESSTHEGVASWATRISVYPSRLDLSLANKLPKSTCELAAVACDLDDLRLSRQNRATLFLKIFSFCKNKVLSKNT